MFETTKSREEIIEKVGTYAVIIMGVSFLIGFAAGLFLS